MGRVFTAMDIMTAKPLLTMGVFTIRDCGSIYCEYHGIQNDISVMHVTRVIRSSPFPSIIIVVIVIRDMLVVHVIHVMSSSVNLQCRPKQKIKKIFLYPISFSEFKGKTRNSCTITNCVKTL